MTVLDVAKSQIGIKESPAGSNNVKYNTWFYGHAVSGSAYPWCAVFIAWCYNQAGEYASIKSVSNKAYCPSYVAWAKKAGRWDKKPSKGALVLFDWDNDGVADHIGIVESVKNSTTIITIEGNTALGNDSNGGQVMRRTRSMGTVLGFAHTGASGWEFIGGDWYFLKKDGEMAKNEWQKDSKGWCYLGSDGKMMKNAWAKDSVGWCYVGNTGHMLSNQWLEWRGDWYFLKKDGHMAENEWQQDSKGWCYLGKDGKMLKDTWLYWKSASYFLKKDGRMATGTLAINESFASDGKWTGGKQA